MLQVDSVNVLQRAHYMPLYSRMGPYDVDLLRRAAERRPRRLVEYWAHVQAFMPVELWPVMQHRMDDYRAKRGKWGFVADDDDLERQPARRGPRPGRLAPRATSTTGCPRAKEHWGWNWSETRKMLDYLYIVGERRDRRAQQPVRDPLRPARAGDPRRRAGAADARRCRGRRPRAGPPGGALPRGRDRRRTCATTTGCRSPTTAAAVGRAGRGRASWCRSRSRAGRGPAYLHRDARLPRRVGARALLSPFDPVVWERARTEALFDFHYRIEIYVPAEKRVHGYYVLPFLLGDRIVGRVDLKADRRSPARLLVVKAAYAEPDAPAGDGRGARRRSCVGSPAGSASPRSRSSRAATWRRSLRP